MDFCRNGGYTAAVREYPFTDSGGQQNIVSTA